MDSQQEAVLRLMQEQNKEKREAELYESDCKRVTGGFLSANDIVKLFQDTGADWPDAPGAEARRLIAEKGLPFLEVGPGRFSVGHSFRMPLPEVAA